jgi:oligoribonuclease NrnB/cAMP/cGMP phosphodiesterase (DHH superfamily)
MLASLPRPEVILTHESDLDGLVSGLLLQRLARKLHNTDVPLEAWNYQAWQKRTLRETAAWVCDLAFEPRLDKPGWLVVDHHPTDLKPQHACLLHDVTKSAGRLCYEQCVAHGLGSPALDRLVALNNVADLFLEDDPDFVTANDYASLVKTYGFWNLHALVDGELERLLDHPLLEVMAVKRRVEDPLGYEWARANVTELSPTVGYVSTVVGNVNLIVHKLLEQKATKFPVLLTLFRKANGSIIVSLRSRAGEALKVAQLLQGGGHPNASGATLPRSIQQIPDAVDYLQRVLHPPKDRGRPLNSLDSLLAGFEARK